MAEDVPTRALEIVIAEEIAAGNSVEILRGTHLEKLHGCDVLVAIPGSSVQHRIQVKGWGEPLMAAKGKPRWKQELQADQYEAAQRGQPYRIEIVADLRAHIDGGTGYDRLTVDQDYIRAYAEPSAYEVDIERICKDALRIGDE